MRKDLQEIFRYRTYKKPESDIQDHNRDFFRTITGIQKYILKNSRKKKMMGFIIILPDLSCNEIPDQPDKPDHNNAREHGALGGFG